MNTSMFLPQVAEQDVFSRDSCQVEDINSILEYTRVLFSYDQTADDEDDDSGQNFSLSAIDYYCHSAFFELPQSPARVTPGKKYADMNTRAITATSFDIVSPPPEW